MKVVYVAGPISKGCIHANIGRAFEAGLALLKAGLSPVVPHGSCFWGMIPVYYTSSQWGYEPEALPAGTTHADWVGMDLAVVARCDALLRLPGESVGADAEVAEAARIGIPVFHSVADVIEWATPTPPAPEPPPKKIPVKIIGTYQAPVYCLPED